MSTITYCGSSGRTVLLIEGGLVESAKRRRSAKLRSGLISR